MKNYCQLWLDCESLLVRCTNYCTIRALLKFQVRSGQVCASFFFLIVFFCTTCPILLVCCLLILLLALRTGSFWDFVEYALFKSIKHILAYLFLFIIFRLIYIIVNMRSRMFCPFFWYRLSSRWALFSVLFYYSWEYLF